MDREKVIKGLEQHRSGSLFDRCWGCPYYELADEPFSCLDELISDALSLLKEQEAKLVTTCVTVGKNLVPICPSCEKSLGVTKECIETKARMPKYCMNCGQAVKWNG